MLMYFIRPCDSWFEYFCLRRNALILHKIISLTSLMSSFKRPQNIHHTSSTANSGKEEHFNYKQWLVWQSNKCKREAKDTRGSTKLVDKK